MSFKDTIFGYLGSHQARTDPNKDANGEGTVQRFTQSVGNEWDKFLRPPVDDLLDNIRVPATLWAQYLTYAEAMLGYDFKKSTLRLGTDEPMRRRLLKHFMRYYDIKGTKRCIELLFKMVGITVDACNETWYVYTFDDATADLDHSIRTWDMNECSPCSQFSLELSGPVYSNDVLANIVSILNFNKPINAVMASVTYNFADITDEINTFEDIVIVV